jgi:hypothetical protein
VKGINDIATLWLASAEYRLSLVAKKRESTAVHQHRRLQNIGAHGT